MPGLTDAERASIQSAVARLGSGDPIVLVVASDAFARYLDNWLWHMDALGIDRIVIVAMDDVLAKRLTSVRFPVARVGFDGSEKGFWLSRAFIWSFLVDHGTAFIHSDVDAVWLRNPIPDYSNPGCDLMMSQGVAHPVDVHEKWGFVLCTGFFWAWPAPATRLLFKALVNPTSGILRSDDQAVLNRLLAAVGTVWMTAGTSTYESRLGNYPFICFHEPLLGFSSTLGLRLTMLPHALFPRVQPGVANPMVRHVMRDSDPEQRINRMREAGCWRVDAWPYGYAFPLPRDTRS
jgi:hypothetical protein